MRMRCWRRSRSHGMRGRRPTSRTTRCGSMPLIGCPKRGRCLFTWGCRKLPYVSITVAILKRPRPIATAIIARRSTSMEREHVSSPARIEANRSNALRSTGPRTPAGKARSSKNALRHGVYSVLPAVPGLEWSEDWETHRDGIFRSLGPEGTVEGALAERVALCFWRLTRVHHYETAITAVGLERIEEQLRPRPPAVRMSFPGLEPEEE